MPHRILVRLALGLGCVVIGQGAEAADAAKAAAAKPDFAAQRRAAAERRAAPAFDAREYAKDPRPYLDSVDPARSARPARAAEGVPQLRVLDDSMATVAPGETVTVRLAAAPHAPVAVTAPDGGQFANGLNVATLVADADGLVEVAFTATPEVTAIATIEAASPLAAGQVRVAVRISEPSSGDQP